MNWNQKYGDPLAHLFAGAGPNVTPYYDWETRECIPHGPKPVLIDGKLSLPDEVDPQKHEYLGTFRPPVPPDTIPSNIGVNGSVLGLYHSGRFDLLSYGTKK